MKAIIKYKRKDLTIREKYRIDVEFFYTTEIML